MISNLTTIRRRALVAASMGLFLGIYYTNINRERTQQKNAAIRFTVQNLGSCIGVAHRALTPNANAVCQKVDLERIVLKSGEFHPVWVVAWEDGQGASASRTMWDAVTGKLLEAVHPVQRPRTNSVHPQSDSSAIKAAWLWMQALGMDRNAKTWHLVRTPSIKHLDWMVTFQAEDCQAIVMMDRQTLDISYFYARYS